MNYTLQRFNRHLPGKSNYHPAINFTNKEEPHPEKHKSISERKNTSLPKDDLYIILADDDADDRELFGEVIEETGLKVKLDYAEDGKDLLNMLESSNRELPHVVFLDLNMPNKGGKECLDVIRSSDRLKNIPVVIYSTSSSLNDIDDTFEKGANLYVRKPSSYHDLLSMARTVLLLDWEQYQPKSSKAKFVYSQKPR